jgi:acylphosphatase
MIARALIQDRLSPNHLTLLTAIIAFLGTAHAVAQSLTLSWDPNPEANIAGYKVYRGAQSRVYTSVRHLGKETSFVPPDLVEGVTYYFAVTAYNTLGMESPFSDEAVATAGPNSPPPNNPPTATPKSATVAEDGSVSITLSGTDPEGATLTYTVTQPPSNGSLSGTPPSLTYRPRADFNGNDSIQYTVSDGAATSAAAAISIQVTAVNDAPKATGSSVTIFGKTATLIVLNASDVDGNALTFTFPTLPTKGVIVGIPPLVTYTPFQNVASSDSFQFKVSDGLLSSAIATVSIAIAPTNAAPVPTSESISLAEDSATNLVLKAADANGDPLSFAIRQSPTNGTISGTPPNIVYSPKANFSGNDTIQFTASDGNVTSTVASISLTVTPVNDRPVATPKSYSLPEDGSVSMVLNGTDVEGSTLTFAISKAPAKGALSGTPPNLTYTPSGNFNGTDYFTFTASDGSLASSAAQISLTVTAINDPPIAIPSSLSTPEDGSLSVALAGSDLDGDTLSYQLTQSPTNGTLVGTAPNFTYRPKTNFSGFDALKFTVSDGVITSAVATVSITVNAVNDPPVATASTRSVAEDTSVAVTLSGTDPEGATLASIISQAPTNGILSGTAPNLVYRPKTNFFGSDAILFKVSDGSLTSAVAAVTITVNPVNDRPVANPTSRLLNEDTSVAITLGGSDVEGSPALLRRIHRPGERLPLWDTSQCHLPTRPRF